jgi:WhiB family redox-sensing transcriptional regulator
MPAFEWDSESPLPCRRDDPDIWFPESEVPTFPNGKVNTALADARALCFKCPARQACLDAALALGVSFGVWGGTTGLERREISAKSGRPVALGAGRSRRGRCPVCPNRVTVKIDGRVTHHLYRGEDCDGKGRQLLPDLTPQVPATATA